LSYGVGDWSERTIRPKPSKNLVKSNLWDFVDGTSICALQQLNIDTEFILRTDPVTWEQNEVYHGFQESIKVLNVTNDLAERTIKMITDLSSNPLTRDEEELQRIVQVVENNRKKIPIVNKSAINEL
jgi:hypothetical protein